MVEPGAVIDMDFEVTVVQDGTAETVRFGDLIFGPTLVSLYMKNNTKSCDRQVSGLVGAAADLFARGVNVLAVSKDTPRAHLNYAAKYDLSFPLVSDPTHLVAQALDAVVEKKMYGKTYLGPARSAVLVDPSGTILARIEKVDTGRHAEQVGQLLEATM